MKSPPTVTPEDCDDIFGPPRTYPTGYTPPKNRPSMISPKYRQKEERRKVLKISISKLRKIEDPEASLCRSVLINNTMKRLQKEARDEKIQKQQLNYPRCFDNDNYLNIKSEFLKNEVKSYEQSFDGADDEPMEDSLKVDFGNDFEVKLAEEIEIVNAKNMDVLNGLVEENLSSLSVEARKRSYEDVEDCDLDVLSQFFMPPTPRMLTCIDDDEDVNVVDDEPLPKRVRTEEVVDLSTNNASNKDFNASVNSFINNNIPSQEAASSGGVTSRMRFGGQMDSETNSSAFSCGHASMFNDLQSNCYHNLIASLET